MRSRGLALSLTVALLLLLVGRPAACQTVSRDKARQALRKAAGFFHAKVASHGGYVWAYSGDLKLREGEGIASPTVVWVQPPGTPTVGEAFLDAYEATTDPFYLDAARDAARALVRGRLRSGGWFYHIEFDPARRAGYAYLDSPPRKRQQGRTMLDDDTTQAAVRFLMRIDKLLQPKDEAIHAAAESCLGALLRAQYPNGAWSANWDRDPAPASDEEYPVKKASFPEAWPRAWPKDFTGCYVTNDNLMSDMIATMYAAADVYGEARYAQSARRAADFLLLAQLPDPQPAWAQQYDRRMHPVWARAFEPPAVTGGESHGILRALLHVYRRTGDDRYLAPIPRAIAYLRASRLPDGRLARFYELQTNRPLYFKRWPDKRYELTYSDADLPTHYAFKVKADLDAIEADYQRAKREGPRMSPLPRAGEGPGVRGGRDASPQGEEKKTKLSPKLQAQVRAIVQSLDDRGAWVERGALDAHDVKPESGIISCRTFVANVRTLCRFLRASEP